MSQSDELVAKIYESEISPQTKQNYISRFRTLLKLVDGKTLVYVLQHPDIYIKKFHEWFPKDGTFKAYVSAILGIFRYNRELELKHAAAHKKWAAAFKIADDAVTKRYETNLPSDKQVKGYVPYDDIIKARDTQPKGSIRRVLLGMYTHLKPMRCEYARCALYETTVPAEPEMNYILLSQGRLIIKQFKTRKFHEGYDLLLPKPLMADITASLDNHPRTWLFTKMDGEPFTNAAFSSWATREFNATFGKPLTVALIRHAFVNSLDFNALSIQEKNEISHQMGHTTATQDKYRLLFNKPPPAAPP